MVKASSSKIETPRKERMETRLQRDTRGWIGWDYITEVANLSENPTLIQGIFLTGGRATEMLELQRGHFADMGSYYEVRGMPVFKKFIILSKTLDKETGRRKYKTQPVMVRRTFPILKIEPLAKPFWDSIKDLDREEKLFSWPGQDDQYWQLYKIVAKIDPPYSILAPMDRMGRQKNLYPHWFRAQRACQLRVDYNLSLDRLVEFFKWKSLDMARLYAGVSSADMAYAMMQGKVFVKYWQDALDREAK